MKANKKQVHSKSNIYWTVETYNIRPKMYIGGFVPEVPHGYWKMVSTFAKANRFISIKAAWTTLFELKLDENKWMVLDYSSKSL